MLKNIGENLKIVAVGTLILAAVAGCTDISDVDSKSTKTPDPRIQQMRENADYDFSDHLPSFTVGDTEFISATMTPESGQGKIEKGYLIIKGDERRFVDSGQIEVSKRAGFYQIRIDGNTVLVEIPYGNNDGNHMLEGDIIGQQPIEQ